MMFVGDGRWDNAERMTIHCLVSLGFGIFENQFLLVTVCSDVFPCCVTVLSSHGNNLVCILQAVRQEIVSYVQLIVEREKKKFNATFKKINKQLGKEKKLLSMDKTKGLIKEHEVPDTLLFCLSLWMLCCPSSFLGSLSVEQGPCVGHQNYFFTLFDCKY